MADMPKTLVVKGENAFRSKFIITYTRKWVKLGFIRPIRTDEPNKGMQNHNAESQRRDGDMNTNKRDLGITITIYLYLALPVLIFMIGWLRWYWALLFGVLTACACIRGFEESVKTRCLAPDVPIEGKTMFTALLLIVLWVYLSGIGGYCYQNSDHEVRSAIFRALVVRDWPVVTHDGSRGLIYYIGFWLPAACVGKLFGLEAGYAAQFLWAVLGIFMVYYLICVYRRKVDLLPILFLIFFSGLDYVGTWLLAERGVDLSQAYHLEWWSWDFQFTSTTSQLFWVFNQSLPVWIATVLVMVQKNGKNMFFILSLIMLTSTIPFVGLIPIAVYLCVRWIIQDRTRWKELLTFQNIVGVAIVGGVSFLYLIGNVSGGKIAQDNAMATASEPAAKLLRYLLFYSLEFGVYLYFVCRYRKKDSLVLLLTAILLLCPFIKVGNGHDFCMRASVPALFILMLLCMETFEKLRLDGKKHLFAAYCAVLLLGAVTPFNEIHRSVMNTFWAVTNGQSVRYPEVDIESRLLQGGNFSGETEGNLFYQYLAKPTILYSEFGAR